MKKNKEEGKSTSKRKGKIIIAIIIGIIIIAIITTLVIVLLNNNKDEDIDINKTNINEVEEIKKESIESELLKDIKYFIETNEVKNIKLEANDNEKYDLNFDYDKEIMYLHVCAADSQSIVGKLVKSKINNRELIQSVKMNCKENGNLKYIVDINNFNNLSEENIEENTVLYDENETNMNKTVSQTKEDYINEYKNSCKTYDYKTIFRYAEDYKGKDVKYTGEVVQVIEGTFTSYRVNVTKDKWGYYENTIYVTDLGLDKTTPRILEDDIITFYGTLGNLYTYETVRGTTVTIPSVSAYYIELKN